MFLWQQDKLSQVPSPSRVKETFLYKGGSHWLCTQKDQIKPVWKGAQNAQNHDVSLQDVFCWLTFLCMKSKWPEDDLWAACVAFCAAAMDRSPESIQLDVRSVTDAVSCVLVFVLLVQSGESWLENMTKSRRYVFFFFFIVPTRYINHRRREVKNNFTYNIQRPISGKKRKTEKTVSKTIKWNTHG